MSSTRRYWWESPWLIWLAVLASAVPLLLLPVPPIVDVPGHMGRYAVQLGQAGEQASRWYDFHWQLIGNLGVDLLVQLLAPILGVELATRLIVTAIPALQAAGFLLVAREVHGRVPPTAFFALPLAYSFPFHFGFINFALSSALSFLALALWVRLGKQGRLQVRATLFVPISLLLWLCHTFGFGLFGLLAFGAEVGRLRNQGIGWFRLPFLAATHCLILTAPFALMLLGRGDAGGLKAHDWFNWFLKWQWMKMVLRDRWEDFDKMSALLLGASLLLALWWKGVRWSGGLLISAFLSFAFFALLPRILFGSAYADMRLFPFAVAIAILAVGPVNRIPHWFASTAAIAALLFFTTRTVATTISLARISADYDRHLAVLPHIPRGARLISLVGKSCNTPWAKHRLDHLPSLALVRRAAFANDQWDLEGSQLIRVKFLAGSGWTNDPSQMATSYRCRADWRSIDEAVAGFPRSSFDYLWLISMPPGARYESRGLVPVWHQDRDWLYRIDHSFRPATS